MATQEFNSPVELWLEGHVARRVANVREAAEVLISQWPPKHVGETMYLVALQTCHAALADEATAEAARGAFVAAAIEAELLVTGPDTPKKS